MTVIRQRFMPVSYTHLDVYKRQIFHSEIRCISVLVVVMSSTERVRRLRQRQRKDSDREELNEFLMNTPFSSNTIEDEKMCVFQNKKKRNERMLR